MHKHLWSCPDDCSKRLSEVACSLRHGQHWLWQSVGRQSSLTKKHLSNRCANRMRSRTKRKARDFTGLIGSDRCSRRGLHALYLCSCTDVAHAGKAANAASARGWTRFTSPPLAGEVGSHREMRSGWGKLSPHEQSFSRRHPHPALPRQRGRGSAAPLWKHFALISSPPYFVCVRIGESFRPLLS
jgi:hypothetical protein